MLGIIETMNKRGLTMTLEELQLANREPWTDSGFFLALGELPKDEPTEGGRKHCKVYQYTCF